MPVKRKYNSENRKGKSRGSYKTNRERKEAIDDTFEKEFEKEFGFKYSELSAEDQQEYRNDHPELEEKKEDKEVDVNENKVIKEVNIINPVVEVKEEKKIEPTQEIKPDTSGASSLDDWKKEYTTITDADKIAEAKLRIESEHDKTIKDNINKDKDGKEKRKYTKKIQSEVQHQSDEQQIRDANAQLMNGSMLIGLCDFFFPTAFKFVYSNIMKNPHAKKVRHKDVVLNEDQVDSIEDVSDAAARIIFAKVNPLILFFLAQSVMYGTNFKLALEDVEANAKLEAKQPKKDEPKKEEKKK